MDSVPRWRRNSIPAIRDGDKRVLVIDGVPVPYCLARVPKAGETRGNLAAGGIGRAQPLTERDREIATVVGQALLPRGLRLLGLDVIGDYLTEINVTSPPASSKSPSRPAAMSPLCSSTHWSVQDDRHELHNVQCAPARRPKDAHRFRRARCTCDA